MVDLDGTSRFSNEVLKWQQNLALRAWKCHHPVRNEARVNVTLSGSGMTEVVLVDLTGRTVKTIASGEMSGAQQFTVNTEELASGSYTVVVKQNGSVSATTIQIVK